VNRAGEGEGFICLPDGDLFSIAQQRRKDIKDQMKSVMFSVKWPL
jgi:hypothetical protein